MNGNCDMVFETSDGRLGIFDAPFWDESMSTEGITHKDDGSIF